MSDLQNSTATPLSGAETPEIVLDLPVDATPPGDAAVDPESSTDASAETAQNSEPQSVRDYILKGLGELETGPDESADDEGERVEPVPAETVAKEAENKEPSGREAQSQAKPADQPEADEKALSAQEGAEKDATQPPTAQLVPRSEILTREEIDKQFNRTSKEIREVAAKNADAALKALDVIDELGGEHFIPAMKSIASGLQAGDYMPVYSGVLNSVGVEEFTDFLAEGMRVAVVDSQITKPTNEGEQYLQDRCRELVNGIVADRLGEGATFDRLIQLYKWDQEGLLNTEDVEKYYTDHAAKDGDADDPDKAEIARLKAELAKKEPTAEDESKKREQTFSEKFDAERAADATKLMDDLWLAKSVLRPVASDPAELVKSKAEIVKVVREQTDKWLREQTAYTKLKKSAGKGESNTAAYKRNTQTLMDSYLAQARQLAAPLESLVSQVYKLSRNGKILAEPADANEQDATGQSLEPTQTKKRETATPVTREAWRKHLADQLS